MATQNKQHGDHDYTDHDKARKTSKTNNQEGEKTINPNYEKDQSQSQKWVHNISGTPSQRLR